MIYFVSDCTEWRRMAGGGSIRVEISTVKNPVFNTNYVRAPTWLSSSTSKVYLLHQGYVVG